MKFIDIHCHILPGMDDGPSTAEGAVEMLRIAAEDGISHLFATPHILDGVYPNRGPEIISSVQVLAGHLPTGLSLLYGADVRVAPDLITRLASGDCPTLGGTGYLLLELPEYLVPPHLDSLIFDLRLKGITPILTHPERHFRLMKDRAALRSLKDRGILCQITAMSVTGGFGREIMTVSLGMIEEGLADFIATDAHNADTRPPVLSEAYKKVRKLFGDKTAEALFFGNALRIVESVK